MGYITLQISPREVNPQIAVTGGTVIVPYPGVKASEIQKVIVEPLQRRLREIEGVEDIYGIAQQSKNKIFFCARLLLFNPPSGHFIESFIYG